jgi:sporulation protein YlmC with PRC-barrel domain
LGWNQTATARVHPLQFQTSEDFMRIPLIQAFAVLTIAQMGLVSPAAAQSVPSPTGNVKFIGYQNPGEMRASKLAGIVVRNKAGEVIGDINDVVFQPSGQATVMIIGVGGVLGVGEKNVAVAFSDVALTTEKDGSRTAVLDVAKSALQAAPSYVGERTTFEKVEDGASSLATAAAQKAKELKDKITEPSQPTNPPQTAPK